MDTSEVRTDTHLVVQEQCDLLRTLVEADAVAVTLVDAQRQVFVASSGLPEPWNTATESDLAHCLCPETLARGTKVTIDQLGEIDLTDGTMAAQLGIAAYIGVPLLGPDGDPFGAICVISSVPRTWTERDEIVVETIGRTINHILLAGAASPPDRHEMAMTAHDLRNPLTVLVGASRRLATETDPEETRAELAAMIQRASTQLEELVDGLLATGRPLGGDRPLRREPVDVAALLDDLAVHAIATHGVDVDVRADAPAIVYSDASAVQRIVQNLVDNAIRHGQPPITMAVEISPTVATISVSNHGEPLDVETRAGLFDPFRPGSSATSRTGLGLHIVWRLANALGGSVTAVDDEGTTTFRVELPQRG